MYYIDIELSNNSRYKVELEKPELIYGMTAIMLTNELDDNVYAINPINGEKIRVIKGNQNRAVIPLHNSQDYELAQKYNLPQHLAVMPYFKGENESKIREDKVTVNRHSVIAIIKHPVEDKYLCEQSIDGKYKSFVQGGIEGEETAEQAAIREIYEETGYKDVKVLNVSKIPVINHFYAAYKGENGTNRFAKLEIVSGVLEDMQQFEIDESEKKKHIVKWVEREELKDFININHNKYALDCVLNDKKIYDGDGIIFSNDLNNNKESEDVREYVINKYCVK